MTIDTFNAADEHGWCLDANTGEIKPSDWDSGTRIRVQNLFAKVPARLKFLRGDRAEVMSILEIVKRLAMARVDVGFTLNNKWFFPKGQSLLERMSAVMGDDIVGHMLDIDAG
jgi:DNA mismatch repair protein MutL